ncbi:hypothetical protein DK59_2936 [Brucella abortus bv. 4 str. 292]|nr:hypothetical protein DK59_2936 [Brucella abortus bv. 4 str. 292]
MDRFQNTRKVTDIVKGQGTVDKIKACFWKLQPFHVCLNIANGIILCVAARAFQHILRKIITGNGGSPLFAGKAAKPAEAASKIGNVTAGQIGQKRADHRPFGCTFQPVYRARQLAVSGEEVVAIINILGHDLSFVSCVNPASHAPMAGSHLRARRSRQQPVPQAPRRNVSGLRSGSQARPSSEGPDCGGSPEFPH